MKITTDKGTIYFAGAREAMELFCPHKGCGEVRLVEIIETAKKKIGFCKCCGKTFPLKVGTGATGLAGASADSPQRKDESMGTPVSNV